MSFFKNVEELPPDAIFLTKTLYTNDKDAKKIDLGIGAYRTDDGKPYVLKIVKKVEKELVEDEKMNKEYAGIRGDLDFVRLSQELILGKNSPSLKSNRAVGAQSISGTGALRILFEFVKENFPNATVYKSSPTWGNHNKIILKAGLKQKDYRYFKPSTRGLDFEGMSEDIDKAPAGSVILFHSCAHNPTGVDPTPEQWEKLADICVKRKLLVFFDSAYQGYASGSLEKDSYAVRLFEKKGLELLIAQSFSKNLGLYGERIGCASIISASNDKVKAIETQLEAVIRPMYSNPPRHGAEIVKRILGNPNNFDAWIQELQYMSGRIIDMRTKLRQALEKLKTPGTWRHITDQIGMFSFTGLTAAQVDVMINKHHVYMLKDGRISMCGVNSKSVDYIAKAIDDVVRNTKSKI